MRCSDLEMLGGKGAATHSPNDKRPGPVSKAMREGFEQQGYDLCTSSPVRGLIEVYPHPALIVFLKAKYRLQYKAAKACKYWPTLSIAERQLELRSVWGRIVETLEQRIEGVKAALPSPSAYPPAAHVPAGGSRPMRTNWTPSSASRSPLPIWTASAGVRRRRGRRDLGPDRRTGSLRQGDRDGWRRKYFREYPRQSARGGDHDPRRAAGRGRRADRLDGPCEPGRLLVRPGLDGMGDPLGRARRGS